MRGATILALLFLAGPAFASQQPAVVGRSVFKIDRADQSGAGVRQARKKIDSLSQDIRKLDRELLTVHTRSQVARAMPSASQGAVKSADTLEQVYRLRRAELVSERQQWRKKLSEQ